MLVHRHKRPRYQIQAPLTALIDIVFLLLIYFLLTTNFITEEGLNLTLPEARAKAPLARQDITVSLDKEGRIFLFEHEIGQDQLFSALKQAIGSRSETTVTVRADRWLELDRVVTVMDIAQAAGASRLNLATQRGL